MNKYLLEKVQDFIYYHEAHQDNPIARNLMVDDAHKIFMEILEEYKNV